MSETSSSPNLAESSVPGGKDTFAGRLNKRLEVEEYFARSGRTLRKGRRRLWFDEEFKPALMELGFRVTGLYARGRRNAISPHIRHVEIVLPELPRPLDGISILQVSDLHIDQLDSLAEALAPLLAPLRPDICVLTGDYRWGIRGSCTEVYPRMRTVLSSIKPRLGMFGILGNHDAAEIAYGLADMGVRMLINDSVQLDIDGFPIWLIGVDDPYDYRCDDLELAMANVPNDAFKILLAHTPGLYREASSRKIDLYLCGHTHAGQIRLPWLGAVKKNGPYPRRFVQDQWEYNGMRGYTSWGAGCSTSPVRFNCPAEAAMIHLRRA